MSQWAAAHLRRLWKMLEFFTVVSVNASEPEDVLAIEIGSSWTKHKRLCDVPAKDRDRARVVWKSFTGTVKSSAYSEDVVIDLSNYHALDLIFDLTLGFNPEHRGHYSDLPKPGQLICGIHKYSRNWQESYLEKWFICDEAFKKLVQYVRWGTDLGDDELGRELLTGDYPDIYWAIARLVLHDNVQAFVDCYKVRDAGATVPQLFMGAPYRPDIAPPEVARHPATGMDTSFGTKVNWRGMWLPKDISQFVHEVSFALGERQWWDTFVQLAAEQDVYHSHPGLGGVCEACMALDPRWNKNGFPYQAPEHRS